MEEQPIVADELSNTGGEIKRPKHRAIRRLVLLALALLFWSTPCCPHWNSSFGPRSLKWARLGCPIPLPKGAHNIQYKTFIFFQAYEEYVVFEAPVAECLAHINTTIKDWNDRDDQRKGQFVKAPITEPPERPHFAIEVPWFDIDTIHSGVQAGSNEPMSPRIWVDTDRGRFYFMVMD